jgi:hypothetical protein
MSKIADEKYGDQKSGGISDVTASILNGIINIGLFLILGVFPLYMDDAYFNILEAKYKFYYLTVIGMMAVILVVSFIMLFVDVKEYKGSHAKAFFCGLRPDRWKDIFSCTDVAVLCFWIVCALSTVRSEYIYESFWGNEGRYSGLFLITLYVIAYFLISRLWMPNKVQYQIFLVAGMAASLLGITDYFQMNLFHLHDMMSPDQKSVFTSTFGNINTYTAYVALYMGFAAMMYATAKNRMQMLWYYLNMIIAFAAIITGRSDNAYLAIGALFGVAPFVLFRYREGTQRYLVMLASLCTVFKTIGIMYKVFGDRVVEFSGILKVISGLRVLPAAAVLLWAAAIGYYIIFIRRTRSNTNVTGSLNRWDDTNGKIRTAIWFGICAVAAAGVLIVLGIANADGTDPSRFGSFHNYLVFSDSWGTNRGYAWRKCIEIFKSFSVEKKLIGYGPDTFGILTMKRYIKEMTEQIGLTFDSAHNEYLQYLITIGALGTAAYITGLITACVRMFRNWERNPYVAGVMFGVLCYAVQALVNLNLPIVTPFMWTLMSMGVATCNRMNK